MENNRREALQKAGSENSASTKFEIERELERLKSQGQIIIEGNILDQKMKEKIGAGEYITGKLDPSLEAEFERILEEKKGVTGDNQDSNES